MLNHNKPNIFGEFVFWYLAICVVFACVFAIGFVLMGILICFAYIEHKYHQHTRSKNNIVKKETKDSGDEHKNSNVNEDEHKDSHVNESEKLLNPLSNYTNTYNSLSYDGV